METTQPIKKGLVFKTDEHGKIVLCIHTLTAIEWLKTLPTDKSGWTQYKLIPTTPPYNRGITHRLVNDFHPRETKPETDFEVK